MGTHRSYRRTTHLVRSASCFDDPAHVTAGLTPSPPVEVGALKPEEGSVLGVVVEVTLPVAPDDGVAGGGGVDISGVDAGTLHELGLLFLDGESGKRVRARGICEGSATSSTTQEWVTFSGGGVLFLSLLEPMSVQGRLQQYCNRLNLDAGNP